MWRSIKLLIVAQIGSVAKWFSLTLRDRVDYPSQRKKGRCEQRSLKKGVYCWWSRTRGPKNSVPLSMHTVGTFWSYDSVDHVHTQIHMNSTVDATYIYSEFGTPASQPQEIREKRREDKHLMDDVFLRPNDDPPWTIPRQRRIPNRIHPEGDECLW